MFGERLQKLREKNQYGQKEVAEIIQKSVQAYSQYELEKRQPDLETLKTLADFYDVSLDYLLGRTDNSGSFLDGTKKHSFPTFDSFVIREENGVETIIMSTHGLSLENLMKIDDYIKITKNSNCYLAIMEKTK